MIETIARESDRSKMFGKKNTAPSQIRIAFGKKNPAPSQIRIRNAHWLKSQFGSFVAVADWLKCYFLFPLSSERGKSCRS